MATQPSLRVFRRRPGQARWRLPRLPFAVAVVGLVGASALLYPSAATWLSSTDQAQEVNNYRSAATAIGPAERHRSLAAAVSYNRQLSTGRVSLPANARLPHADSPAAVPGYLDQLDADDDGLMGRLRIPSIDADLPIYHGTSDSVLDKGIGHLQGTSLPVGGTGTHSVLTGHRGLASAELFTKLNELRSGDRFTIEVLGQVLVYRITKTSVVEPDETRSLQPVPGNDLVTLVTCTPLFINSQRILVTGERVLPTPLRDRQLARAEADGWLFPWWMVAGGVALLLSTGYVWWCGRPARRAQRGNTAMSSRRGSSTTQG